MGNVRTGHAGGHRAGAVGAYMVGAGVGKIQGGVRGVGSEGGC